MQTPKITDCQRLARHRALITGGGRGIGRAIALRFAEEGADIAINYVGNIEAAEQTGKLIRQMGRKCEVIQADVSQVKETRALVEMATQRLGSLDILVNNAGFESKAPFWEVTEENYDRVLNTNLKGAFFTAQAFVRHRMTAETKGRIINVSSVHEDLPFPGFATYCASKGGLRMLTRNLAIELARYKIAVNAIAPGAIETDINRSLLADQPRLLSLIEQVPARRMGKPEEVAAVAAFLASPEAEYVTGATYFIDGGLTWNYSE